MKLEWVLSENLRRLRKARGFRTQEAFAEAAGIPFRTYQDAERGKSWPEKKNLEKIAAALGVAETHLFICQNESPRPSLEQALAVIRDELGIEIRKVSPKRHS